MELLHQETIDLEQVADLCDIGIVHPAPEPRNHSAWHVTDLLKAGHLIARGDNRYPASVEQVTGIMSLGRIWESVMDCFLMHYADLGEGLYFPDAVCDMDGVEGSLDGIILNGLPCCRVPLMVVECKLRFTLNTDIPLGHLQQIRAYCHLADTDTVCYVSGHVSSAPPTMRAYLRVIRFTELSIQETWQGILNTKRYLEGLGIGPRGA